MRIPKTPVEFDYDLWTTEDGKCMVRVKRSGEVTEVDRDVMRILRAEEKRIRRSYGADSNVDQEKENESHNESILSLDALPDDEVMAKAKFLMDTGFSSQDELDIAVNTAQSDVQKSRAALKSIEAKIAEKKELQKWVISYAKTKDVRDKLKTIKSEKKRAEYRADNDSDFIIADAAVRYFKAHGIAKLPTYKALQSEIERLIAEKNVAYNAYYEAKAHHTELATIQHNLSELHGEPIPEKTKRKNRSVDYGITD